MAVALACNRRPKLSNDEAFLLVKETHALDSAWYIDLKLGKRNMPKPSSSFRMLREDGYLNYADPDGRGFTFVSLTEKGKRFRVPGADSNRVRVGFPVSWKVLSVSDTLEGDRYVKVAYVQVLLDSVSPFSVCQYNFDTVMLYQHKFIDLNGKWVDHGGGYVGPLQMTMEEARGLASKDLDAFGHLNIPRHMRLLTKDTSFQKVAKLGYLTLDSSSASKDYLTITGKGIEFVEQSSDKEYYVVRTANVELGKKIEIENVITQGRKQTVLSYWYELKDTTPFFNLNMRSNPYIGFKDTYERRGWKWSNVKKEVQ
ncbi:hypothetical protein DBR11_20885 [Pedobacter sp. HMWF019]|nr:hypothetical protein DBR11_20885 [Pedobacter sp. HMWF019]